MIWNLQESGTWFEPACVLKQRSLLKVRLSAEGAGTRGRHEEVCDKPAPASSLFVACWQNISYSSFPAVHILLNFCCAIKAKMSFKFHHISNRETLPQSCKMFSVKICETHWWNCGHLHHNVAFKVWIVFIKGDGCEINSIFCFLLSFSACLLFSFLTVVASANYKSVSLIKML